MKKTWALLTREVRAAIWALVVSLALAFVAALVVPMLGVWRANCDAQSAIARARGAAHADSIRARALANAPGARLLLEMRSIEERSETK